MRIAMVHSSFAIRGGAERYVRDLSAGLAARGHDVRVFSRPSEHDDPGDQPVAQRLSDRVGGRSGPLRKVLNHLGDMADPTGLALADLEAFAPDVVHVHNWQGLGIRPVRRLAAAYPTCHSVHDFAVADPGNALGNRGRAKALDAMLAARSALLVRELRGITLLFPSERTRRTLLQHVPAAAGLPQRVVLLSTPVPAERRALPPGARDTFLYMGALSPHKGVGDLLDAWTTSDLRHRGTLLFGGDGPMRAEVEAAAAAHPSVHYLGYLDEAGKTDALRRAGWLLFPSRWPETYGLVCAEALIAGRPVLASRIAEPVMAAPGSCLLFDSPQDLRERLEQAAQLPPAEYAGLTASALADGARLDWDTHVEAIVASYESVRADRRVPETGHR
ncbi:glycosyltransferase family 4 protein [Paractinoplanes rishiriensis]|uniref:Glycosyl transferase n=1 Tax=Paractinoplanes rishiriensis TaxID=1050105 RepID=A0A919K487_9ACTN|nr:glycosyltransferase family 4 protein [Actinoplanes rishiriensis]GIF00501.1 glycosyl transferase [Actinoplanes rishiriensis]